MPRSQCEKENVQLVQELAEVDGPFESPINFNFRDLIKLELPSLTWNKSDSVPKKMKVTNTGHTVIISGKWKCERPYLSGGPLDGKYVFSQIHFHWGPDDSKGSEHQVCGESFPLEMHVAHFKTEYMTQESALKEKDGMVVLVYLFKLQNEPNASLKKIISTLPCIKQSSTSQAIECRSILSLLNPFTDDYFMYWGSVVTSTCAHILLWIVCREPFGISRDQMEEFRKILDCSQHPIKRNSREPQPLHKRNVFHVNASRHMDEPMLPVKTIMGCFCYPTSTCNESDKKSGDGCTCNSKGRPQEELEGRQDSSCRQDIEKSRGNGVYMQQTVYFQHATVHSVPALPKRYAVEDQQEKRSKIELAEKDSEVNSNVKEISQSCCFLSVEEAKSLTEHNRRRERVKQRKRKPFDSVTTLANLIDTLETLKNQTYKKLKEIESINHEIRDMKSSCENLEEKHWLRHAEKIMSRQKRFTIRSSQCCFSELKKLAKECNFDKLLDGKMLTSAEGKPLFLTAEENADTAVVCSNASGDRMEIPGLEKIESTPFSFYNQERFSRKAQKLIRSFFEDIRESEETQLNLEKNLQLKKFKKLPKKKVKSDHSNASSLDLAPGQQVYITKNMLNLGQIRDQFFSEVTSDEKETEKVEAIQKAQPEIIPPEKKKNRSFFKLSLSAYDSDKQSANRDRKPLFNNSALNWLNNRLNHISDNSPVIPLRITDIELKSGTISTALRRKSKHSVKSIKPRKAISDEHIRTEVSSFMSESVISEFSDKQSKLSKQSRTKVRTIIRGVETNSDTRRSELSFMRVVKELDANNFFVHLENSANFSSGTSSDSERKDPKFIKRQSRKELWENGSSSILGFRKEFSSKREIHKLESYDEQIQGAVISITENLEERRLTSSSDSSEILTKVSSKVPTPRTSKSVVVRSRDVSVDATEHSLDSPKRKKLKLEWKCKSVDVQPNEDGTEVHTISYIETECHKISYVESECQADIKQAPLIITNNVETTCDIIPTPISSQEKICMVQNINWENVLEKSENQLSPTVDNESQTETEKESVENSERAYVSTRNTSVEAIVPLPSLIEEIAERSDSGRPKSQTELNKYEKSENEASEISVSPRRSWDTTSEPSKDNMFDMKREVSVETPENALWEQEDDSYTRMQTSTVEVKDAAEMASIEPASPAPEKSNESFKNRNELLSVNSDAITNCELGTCSSPDDQKYVSPERSHSVYFGNSNHLLLEEYSEKKPNEDQVQLDSTRKDSEYGTLFTVEEMDKSRDASREISQNEFSECNEYDLQTDSNATTNYNQQKETRSRDTTPSIFSSEDEKNRNISSPFESSTLRLSSQHKPFSAESFNSFKNTYEMKQRKRRQCIKKKSKPLVRKNNSMIRKLNKIGGSSLDFTNLTEEEQLKIISANVARFVKQKLVEHRQFFDFEKNEPMTFDVEQWSKTAEPEMLNSPDVTVAVVQEESLEKSPDIPVEPEVVPDEETKPITVKSKLLPPLGAQFASGSKLEQSRPSSPQSIKEEPVPPPKETAPVVAKPEPVAPPKPEPDPTPKPNITSRPEPATPLKEEVKEKRQEVVTPPSKVEIVETAEEKDAGGDIEKDDKSEAAKPPLDFIKLNKMLAGKYKRRVPAETPKKGPKQRDKSAKKEEKPKKEEVTPPPPAPVTATTPKGAAKPGSTNRVERTEPATKPEKPKTAGPLGVREPGKQTRAPSVDTPKRGLSLQRPQKSEIPTPTTRDATGSPKPVKGTIRSASATPKPSKAATPTAIKPPNPTVRPTTPKVGQPKKRLVPTYTLTSYTSPPNEVIENQQREWDKCHAQGDIADFFRDESRKSKKLRKLKKGGDKLAHKNLDYLIRLQKRINYEISANIENSMNYVKTLLSQDYNGTAIIEKAPVKNFDVYDNGSGIVFIELSDQYECSSSSSEFSEESGFYCLYKSSKDKGNPNANRRSRSGGDSGLADGSTTDSSWFLEGSPMKKNFYEEKCKNEKLGEMEDVTDILKKYIYHLGGGEESPMLKEGIQEEEVTKPKSVQKKRKERVLDIPMEMKRKLLDLLENEMRCEREPAAGPVGDAGINRDVEEVEKQVEQHRESPEESEEVTGEEQMDSNHQEQSEEDCEELTEEEMLWKISEMVQKYLDDYDKDQEQESDYKGGESVPLLPKDTNQEP